MKVIGIVGYPASGKGEFSDTAKALGIPVFGMGDERLYGKTIDLATTTAMIFLAHEDQETILKALDEIDWRAKNKPESIYITV